MGFMLFEMSFGTLTRLVAVDVAQALSKFCKFQRGFEDGTVLW